MTVEDIELAVGNRVYGGRLNVPDEPSSVGVLVLPGGGHGPYGGIFDRFSEEAAEAGMHVLRYQSWSGPLEFQNKTYGMVHEEMDAAVGRLQAEGCETIYLVGKSFGGGVALTYVPAAVDRMVLWSPAMRVAEGASLEDVIDVVLQDLEEPPLSPEALTDIDVPVGVVQGDADEVQLPRFTDEVVDGIPQGELIEVEGLDHSYSDREWGQHVTELTLEYLTR